MQGKVLVVGGGIAGLTAAERLGRAGVEVLLAEKSPFLGGRVARLHRYYPRLCPPRCGLEILIRNINSFPHVETCLLTEVTGVQKKLSGHHTVTLRTKPRLVKDNCTACGLCEKVCPVEKAAAAFPGQRVKAISGGGDGIYPAAYYIDESICLGEGCSLCAGACPEEAVDLSQCAGEVAADFQGVILAAGGELYDPALIREYGYGSLPGVITAMEFESLFRPDGPTGGMPLHPATGKPLDRVAFIQCAGSRDKNHLSYCSGYCCTVTLKQVEYLHRSSGETGAWIFYQDMRTPGDKEEYYSYVREEYRPVFVRGLPSGIEYDALTGKLKVRAVDTLSRKNVAGEFDLVVLATGMVPTAPDLFEGIDRNGSGFLPGHSPCDPTEIRRSGVWAAGCLQSPMDAGDSVKSALAAVAQCLIKLQQQPAEYPRLDRKKCDRCGRCVKECAYGACTLGSDGYPEINPVECRGCGICQGGCPLLCLNLPGYGVDRIEPVVDRVLSGEVPSPSILLFLCGNDSYPAWNSLVKRVRNISEPWVRKGLFPYRTLRANLVRDYSLFNPDLREQGLTGCLRDKGLEGVIPFVVPCIGSVNGAWINEALIGGLDGVMLAGCSPDQCHHGIGTAMANTRLDNLKETLTRMRLEPERVYLTEINIDGWARLDQEIQKFSRTLEKLGPSPFK